MKRQIGQGESLGLYYCSYHNGEPSNDGFNDFTAQAVFATLSFQLP